MLCSLDLDDTMIILFFLITHKSTRSVKSLETPIIISYIQPSEDSSPSRQALRDFLDIILDTSAPSESVEVRQRTAEVLGMSDMRDLFLDSLRTLG